MGAGSLVMFASCRDSLKLHWVVLLVSCTAIGGKVVTLSAPELIWYRTLIAGLSFWVYLRMKAIPFRVEVWNALQYLAVGLVVALHWTCFFGAIKLSNVSFMLGVMSTTTLFASFMEPLLFRRRLSLVDIGLALVVIAGLYLIFQYETGYLLGGVVALLAAMSAAAFTVINKKFVESGRPSVISFYEMCGGFLGISLYLVINPTGGPIDLVPTPMDFLFILFLGMVCTAYAFTTFVELSKRLSAYYVVLGFNMEPVYGIVMALLIFGESEMMTPGFYTGALIILMTVMLYPFLKKASMRGRVRV